MVVEAVMLAVMLAVSLETLNPGTVPPTQLAEFDQLPPERFSQVPTTCAAGRQRPTIAAVTRPQRMAFLGQPRKVPAFAFGVVENTPHVFSRLITCLTLLKKS